jgi:hypothetical protein
MTPPPRPPLVPGGPRLVLDLVESGVTAAKEPIPGWREVILTLVDELREARAQLAEHEAAWAALTEAEPVDAAARACAEHRECDWTEDLDTVGRDEYRKLANIALAAARTAARRRGP